MLQVNKSKINHSAILDELLTGSGVVVIKQVYSLSNINKARTVVNHYAENQEQKESHFNAEAESSNKIHLQQRVWNLFPKDKIFCDLISHNLIFNFSSFINRKVIFTIV